MPAPFGIVATGFNPKTLDEIKIDIETQLRTVFGAGIDVSVNSHFGLLVGIMAERYAELWQLGEANYNAAFPDTATGQALAWVGGFLGLTFKPATKTEVTLTLTGAAATVIPSGSQASVDVAGSMFETVAGGVLVLGSAWAASTAYAVGDKVRNGANTYVCTVAGTSAGAGGPTGGGSAIVDNTVTWHFVGVGVAWADVEAEAVEAGIVPAFAFSVINIETPVAGWSGVSNVADHTTLGTNAEDDTQFRARFFASLRSPGSATDDAIRAALLALPNVTDCFVFSNESDATDGDGLPPHSVECVVDGGTNLDVATSIHETKPSGEATYGNTTQGITDSQGFPKTIRFSRPVNLNAWIVLTVKVDATFPLDGAAQVAGALATWGDANLKLGSDLASSALVPSVFTIPGVLETTLPFIGTAPAPVSTVTIAASNRQVIKLDTSRITVNVTT